MDEQQEKDEKKIIKISVRNLVEFILREGDIDNRHGRTASPEAMWEGSRIHKRIQKSKGANYHAEVPLKIELSEGDYTLAIEGRADGIEITCDGERQPDFSDNFNHLAVEEGMHVTIDEIKGIYMNLDALDEAVGVHRAQAMCYAYIYALQHDLAEISVQLTYCNLDTIELTKTAFLGNLKYFRETFSFAELAEWFTRLTDEYKKWADFQFAWQNLRQASIKKLEFPYAYRKGQKELASDVYRTIARRKNLFIQAPTGVGKTISTVFPAVKAVGEGLGDKIFYLTAKTVTRTVAEEAFSVLKGKGLRYKVLTLTAKEKICPLEEAKCNPIECPYAKGHYDRVNEAVFEMLNETEVFDREAIWKQSEKWKVCPYEMTLDLSMWVDAVICDYNYVFDPNARLKRFFGDNIKGEYLFLIDEAHNLVERGREMYSASLCKERFLEIRRLLKSKSRKISRTLEKCNRVLLEWKRECEDYQIRKNISELILPLMNLCGELEDFLEEEPDGEVHEKLLEFYFEVSKFLNIYDLVDDHYVIYTYYAPDGSFLVRLYCVDTSANIQKCLDKANAAVFFSATLLPVQYYISLLSEAKDDYAIYARSPFDPKNRAVLIGTDVSSRYTRRGQEEYMRIAAYIKQTVMQKKGNYLAFFPSYRMPQDVMACTGPQLDTSIRCICQTSGMTEEEREAFLHEFEQKRKEDEGLLGFCVMGGIFGEGIDLKEDSLIGAIIVGTGIPQICREREILKQYYDGRNEDGFAYAYRYPGMNKVLQSAGRVIRTAQDRGVVLLLDERFAKSEYRKMFPREWEECEYCSRSNVADKLGRFWELSEYEH